LIPAGDILGVTVILLGCKYKKNEFIRVGYYLNNEVAEGVDVTQFPNGVPHPSLIGTFLLSNNKKNLALSL
jgi:hypothetical protein